MALMASSYGKGRTRKLVASSRSSSERKNGGVWPFSPERSNDLELKKGVGEEKAGFYIESPNKPKWSPHFSPKKGEKGTKDRKKEPHVKRKLEFGRELKAPEKKTKKVEKKADRSGWDLLDSGFDDAMKFKPKKLLRDDSTLSVCSSKEESSSSELELVKFLDRESQDIQSQDTAKTGESQTFNLDIPASLNQSPVRKSNRTYGLQRSYLVEREQEEKQENGSDEADTAIELSSTPIKDKYQSITQLRLHGQNSQKRDDLNFLVEGFNEATNATSVTTSLLELALSLFDDDFVSFLTANIAEPDFAAIEHKIDISNEVHLYIWNFIMCKITDSKSHFHLEDKDVVIKIFKESMKKTSKIPRTKLPTATNSLFKQFLEKLEGQYSFRFLGLVLLSQNQIVMTNELFNDVIDLVSKTKENELSENEFQISLVLIGNNFNDQYITSDLSTHNSIQTLIKQPFTSTTSLILILKTIILLVPHYKSSDDCFDIPMILTNTKNQSKNDEVTSLYIGLLINLYDLNESTQKLFTSSECLELIYDLYVVVGKDSLPYLCLLIGRLYTSGSRTALKNLFHKNELSDVKLQLEKFNSQGNSCVKANIEKILSQFELP